VWDNKPDTATTNVIDLQFVNVEESISDERTLKMNNARNPKLTFIDHRENKDVECRSECTSSIAHQHTKGI